MRKGVLLCLLVAMTIVVVSIPHPAAASSCDGCESSYWSCWITCDDLYWPNNLDAHDRCAANCDHTFLRCLRGCSI